MLLSMNWIQDFVNLDGFDLDDLIHRFTLSTAEVEDIYHKGSDISGVISAKIIECEPHPDSKKLHLLKVDTGTEIVDCVCGAPNARKDLIVAFATEGGNVCGNAITKATVAGYTSYGMCCSKAELGISADSSGIWELPEETPLGVDIKKLYPIEDTIFEVDNKSLTNRPDLWGHYGIAREFAALTDRQLQPVKTKDLSEYNSLPKVDIEIEDTEHCFRYSSLKVDNVTEHESTFKMQIRLFYCGMRGINLLTDLTNYIMLELGQPMHAFDRRKVDKINVKRFDSPMTFKTLDENDRNIDENTLMICSDGKPVAIAGIMGGLDSSIMDDTSTLLLESANFDGICVRKSSSRMGLRTDASMRYEKMLDPEMTLLAVERFMYLLYEIDPNVKVVSSLSDNYPTKYPKITLEFNREYVDRYTGINISDDTIEKTLTALGFKVDYQNKTYKIEVPSWRATKDVTIKADIIEEITRIYGYDNFEIKTTKSPLVPRLEDDNRRNTRIIKDILVQKYALHEVNSYIWCDNKKYADLNIDVEDNVKVINAMTVDNSVLRNSIVPSLLVFIQENKGFSPEYGIFEMGRAIKGKKEDGSCNERRVFGIVLTSHIKNEKELFFKLRDILHTIAENLKHSDFKYVNIEPQHNWQHPKNTVGLLINGNQVGTMCTLHPNTGSAIDKKGVTVAAEIDLDSFCKETAVQLSYKEPSKFPGIDIDLSFVCKSNKFADIEKAWDNNKYELLKDYRVIDVYDGDIPSISVRLSFSSDERTLTRNEIQPIIDEITDYLKNKDINLKS